MRRNQLIGLFSILGVFALIAYASPAQAQTTDVGILRGRQGCPAGTTEFYVFMDDEDSNNANGRSGWLGASVSDRNTTFRFCRVSGWSFPVLSEPYMVLKLGSHCPSGSTHVTRHFDAENYRPASHSNIPNAITSDMNVTMTFCAFTGTPTGSAFPDYGVEYGVFAASGFSYAIESGYIYTDNEDDKDIYGRNQNYWCEAGPPYGSVCYTIGTSRNYWNILVGGLNTGMSIARVK